MIPLENKKENKYIYLVYICIYVSIYLLMSNSLIYGKRHTHKEASIE